jgi:hypothetical protein
MPARGSSSYQFLNSLKPREVTFELTDAGCPGLRMRGNKTGSKSWDFVYRRDGKLYRWTLGTFPGTSLESARTQVSKKREAVKKDGRNPVVEERRRKAQLDAQSTVREPSDLYIENHAKPRKRTWKEDKRILDKDVIPEWGEMRAGCQRRHRASPPPVRAPGHRCLGDGAQSRQLVLQCRRLQRERV